MPQPPASERGVTRQQPEIVTAKNIDIRRVARVTGGLIWASNTGNNDVYLPDRIEFPQKGTTLIVGREKGPILEYPHEFPGSAETAPWRFIVDAVIIDEAVGSVTFVAANTDQAGQVLGLTKITLKEGQEEVERSRADTISPLVIDELTVDAIRRANSSEDISE